MTASVNGADRELRDGTTVAELVEELGAPATGTAVAVDLEVVPRGAWERTRIPDGARVEVLTAVQGG
jgi:sulfur carrier protein